MPFISKSSYKPPLLFKSSYVNTIYPAVFRKSGNFAYVRERIDTPDDDFLDLDWSRVGSDNLVIVLHGLEGSAQSQYSTGISAFFNEQGWDALAVNHRSCSGVNNNQPRSYHLGATDDVAFIINHVIATNDYDNITLVGFSLGGNLTLKYLGEQGEKLPPQIKAGAAFSTPLHIPSANVELNRPKNKMYLHKFLTSMILKSKDKMKRFPNDFPQIEPFKPRNFNQYDEMITAPVHGFKNAQHYWESSSCIHFIPDIKIPVLLVNAVDDTFLSKRCYPIEMAKNHPFLHFEMPKYGGHCGFYERDKAGFVWFEKRSFEFFENVLA